MLIKMKNSSFEANMEDEGEEKDGISLASSKEIKEIPRHPKWCPDCLKKGQRSKVKIFSINENGESIYMCSNMKCVWPLATHSAEQIYGMANEKSETQKIGTKDISSKEELSDSQSDELLNKSLNVQDTDNDLQSNSDINALSSPKSFDSPQTPLPVEEVPASSNDKSEGDDITTNDIDGEHRNHSDINTQSSSPSPFLPSPNPEEPQFLRPFSTTFTPKHSNDKDVFNGRITPPPAMISPLPATPAGSMTPASNYEGLRTPHYDYWADLETENESEADGMETPRRDANDFDMPSFASPMPSLLSPIPSISSPMHSKSKSPRYTSLSSMIRKDKKSPTTSLENVSDSSDQSSPLKLTLSRRTSECGKRNQWNIDTSNQLQVTKGVEDDISNDSDGSIKAKGRLKNSRSDSVKTQSISSFDSNDGSSNDATGYTRRSNDANLHNSKRIDKNVLNLKKTAGAGVWTSTVGKDIDATTKSSMDNDDAVSVKTTVLSNSRILPKQQRSGRKSKVVQQIVANPKLGQTKMHNPSKEHIDKTVLPTVNNNLKRMLKSTNDTEEKKIPKLNFLKIGKVEKKNNQNNEVCKKLSPLTKAQILPTFKKPFILKKVDPAVLCNKTLVKIDPSQIPAIFKNKTSSNIVKPKNRIVAESKVTLTKVVGEQDTTSEASLLEVTQTTNGKPTENKHYSKSTNETAVRSTSEANKENGLNDENSNKNNSVKILPSLSNRLYLATNGVECTVSIDLPPETIKRTNSTISNDCSSKAKNIFDQTTNNKSTLAFNAKEMIDLSKRYIKSADEEFPEFNKLMKDFDSYKKKSKQCEIQNPSYDLALKIQDSLSIPKGCNILSSDPIKRNTQFGSGTNLGNGVVITIKKRKKTIDLPVENEAYEVRETVIDNPSFGSFKISLTSDSDGIEAALLKRPPSPSEFMRHGSFTPHDKKRGRPKKEPGLNNFPKPSRLNADLISHPQDVDLNPSRTAQEESAGGLNGVPNTLPKSTGMSNANDCDSYQSTNMNVQSIEPSRDQEAPSNATYTQQPEFSNSLPINPPCVIQLNNVGYRTINGLQGSDYSNMGINDSTQVAPIPMDPIEEFLHDQRAVSKFMHHLNILMEGFDFPSELAGKVDPYIAMMLFRKHDPLYSNIGDFDTMMLLYSKILNHEFRKQQLIQQQLQQQQMQFQLEQYQQNHSRNQPSTSAQVSKTNCETEISRQFMSTNEVSQQRNGYLDNRNNQENTANIAGTRTYTEPQPVENTSKCNDGTEVLRRHQESSKIDNSNYRYDESCNNISTPKGNHSVTKKNDFDARLEKEQDTSALAEEMSFDNSRLRENETINNESNSQSQLESNDDEMRETGKRVINKQEILMPPSVASNQSSPGNPKGRSNLQSIKLTSVHPNPCQSITEVPANLPLPGGKAVGNGDLIVSYTFENCHCGPIYVNSEKEAQAIVFIVEEKYGEKQAKNRLQQLTGLGSSDNSSVGKKFKRSSKQIKGVHSPLINPCAWARSLLPQDILAYVDRSFTQRGMKENVVGRKKKNYPKRSRILKVCPKTGELIYPPGHPKHIDQQKKNEELLLSTNIKKEVDIDAPLETSDDYNENELEKAVFAKELQKVDQKEKYNRDRNNILSQKLTKFDEEIQNDKDKKNSTQNPVEEEDSEADIELDCYNPSTPQVQENIEKILSKTRNSIESSQETPLAFSKVHVDSDSENDISTDIDATIESELSPRNSKTSTNPDNIKFVKTSRELEYSKLEENRKRKFSTESDQKKEPANMKVSLALFKSKNNRRPTASKKRKISENESIYDESFECNNHDMAIDEDQSRNKEEKSKSNQVDAISHDISFSRSRLSETKTTYVRKRRPFSNTPGSSIHSPAPYNTPSYAPSTPLYSLSPCSLPSPLSPFGKFNNYPKRVNEINQIDMSPSVDSNTLDVEEILIEESKAANKMSRKSLDGAIKTSTSTITEKFEATQKESHFSAFGKIPLPSECSNMENSKSTSKVIDQQAYAPDSNNSRTSIPKAPDEKKYAMKSKSKPKPVIKSPMQTRATRNSKERSKNDILQGLSKSNVVKDSESKTAGESFCVFHRKYKKLLAERIAAFRKKQEKKQHKIKKILERREAKKAALSLIEDDNEIRYKGIGMTDEQLDSKIHVSSLAGKLTKAEEIGGVRRVLKPSSKGYEIVQIKCKEEEEKGNDVIIQSHSNKERDLQAERDLVAELLKFHDDSVAQNISTQNNTTNSQLEEFEMAQTSYSPMHQMQEPTEELFLDM